MASPRVFISSTCYDLAEERDGLNEFCGTFGFETTLSERGDIFYHPDLHTHLSCVRETGNCHLFILIIGGRFGGKYLVDPSKSITNAEYSAAVQSGTPTFTFIKQDVLNDHNVWQRNKEQPFANSIQYPSIDRQEHAVEIFKFIDIVRLAPVNNGMFGFRLGREIHEILRKQWAGMMFDFLQNRTIAKQLSLTNDALGNLSVVSTKIEELVKGIYRNIDSSGADGIIKTIETESIADEFLLSASKLLSDLKFINEMDYLTATALPSKWWQFVTDAGWCTLKDVSLPDGSQSKQLLNLMDNPVQTISGSLKKEEEIRLAALQRGYEVFKSLSEETRLRLASRYFWTKADADAAAKFITDRQPKSETPVV